MRSTPRLALALLLALGACRRAATDAPGNTASPTVIGDRVEKRIERESYGVDLREGQSAHVDLFRRASVCLDKNDVAGARALYEEAHRLEPTRAEAVVGLGTCELHERHLDKARDFFHQAAALDARSTMAQIGLGSAFYLDGRFRESAGAYQAAIALDDRSADAHWGAATANLAIGDREAARTHARRFLALAPDSALVPRARQIAEGRAW